MQASTTMSRRRALTGKARETGARRALRWSCRAFWSNMNLGQHSNFIPCGPTAKLQRVQRAEPPPRAASHPRGPCWRGLRCW